MNVVEVSPRKCQIHDTGVNVFMLFCWNVGGVHEPNGDSESSAANSERGAPEEGLVDDCERAWC